ncbi:MAG: pyridoxamine 5'-phosphate oxidase family protein [Chloroflexota bacterium]|nr:pyridoxamine 5'-phosphate oxidase family protein [Chloroflexota bacterium]
MGVIRNLSPDECAQAIRELGYGRLAVTTGEGPYAVPMMFALDDTTLCFYTLPGRKLAALRAHPAGVAVEFDDIDSARSWHSVLVTGHFEEGPDETLQELISAFRCRAGAYVATALAELRSPSAVFGRIVIDEMSGRAYRP